MERPDACMWSESPRKEPLFDLTRVYYSIFNESGDGVKAIQVKISDGSWQITCIMILWMLFLRKIYQQRNLFILDEYDVGSFNQSIVYNHGNR